MKAILLALLFIGAAFAQLPAAASHSVTLSWVDSINPTGTTYNVYKGSGNCPPASTTAVIPAGSTMPQIATGVAALTWIDSASTLAVGQTNCYLVSAVVSGVESCSAAASATCGTGNPLVSATIPSGTPTSGVNPVTGLKWIAK